MRTLWRTFWPPALVFIGVTLALELAVRSGLLRDYLVPRPTQVVQAFRTDGPELLRAAGSTAFSSFAGFALSASIGIVLAILLASGGWVQRAFYPYAIFFQTVPIIAIAPLLVIWFGLDRDAVVASSFVVSVFPVLASTLAGLRSTDPALRDLFQLYGAGRAATLLKLRVPFAMPSIMTGLRIAAGLAVIGSIAGEFITGDGLGGLILVSRQRQRVDKVFALLLLSAVLGIVMFALVNSVSRLALRHWHASEKDE